MGTKVKLLLKCIAVLYVNGFRLYLFDMQKFIGPGTYTIRKKKLKLNLKKLKKTKT